MKVYNKIGFHLGPGGNASGIGEWMRALDEAKIPFFIKSVDSYGPLREAAQIAQKSGVDHTIIFRLSTQGQDDGYDYDVPPYKDPQYQNDPEGGAEQHWQRTKARLSSEFDKSRVWIEPVNEVDKNLCDWLGRFGVHLANLAHQDGYKVSLFAWSSGEPEPEGWEEPGMLAYLRLCGQRPNQAAVALHEYSYLVDDIEDQRPFKIGRFQFLFDACDKHNIARPTVHITEWGWTLNDVPRPLRAMRDIKKIGELYARYPQIKGAAIWYLGPGFGRIADKTQKLIKPLTRFTLKNPFDVPDPEKPETEVASAMATPSPIPVPTPTPAPAPQPNARFIQDVTVPDDTPFALGAPFTKTWRVLNNGNVAWKPGYKLVYTAGTNLANVTSIDLPVVQPGRQVDLSLRMTTPQMPGVYFSDWRFQDEQGNFFGDIVYARIVAQATAPPPQEGISNGRFVADITIPDDSEIEPATPFVKTWRVQNTGTRAWGPGFTLNFIGGLAMTETASHPLPGLAPGAEANVSIRMTAPTVPGVHFGDWRMKDDRATPFGEVLYVRIVVPAPAVPSLAKPYSQRDPRWINKRLGHAGSPKTIGEWGCLLTCYAMIANTFGNDVTPSQLNDAMLSRKGFINGYFTKWNALSNVYNHIIFEGKFGSHAGLLQRIDASLEAGRPVPVQVDFTRDTPYSDNDQHWVLIVAKDGDDYRINDPWLYPPQEASLQERYGRSGQPLWKTTMSAVFYRSIKEEPQVEPERTPEPPVRLQAGMNVNPDAPHSNPVDNDDLKGLDWVRFVFKVDARVKEEERGRLDRAFAQYDPIIRQYNKKGIKSLLVINQETVWGIGPWTGNGNWPGYADQLAEMARRIAARYQRYGEEVAYQIWNEGDKRNNPASVYVEPEAFAIVLRKTAAAIRSVSPDSPIIFNGMATGPEETIAYLQRCKKALDGPWPVDAIGIHPYTRWATRAPFDWGQKFGTLGEAFAKYRAAIPDMPFWITEIGVADDNEIGPEHYAEIAGYLKDVYQHVGERYADLVPVVIWFAWSDWMRNAGIVDKNGRRKDHVYLAFRAVRNREIWE